MMAQIKERRLYYKVTKSYFFCTILVNLEKKLCLCPPEIDATTCHGTPARCSTTTSVVVLVFNQMKTELEESFCSYTILRRN